MPFPNSLDDDKKNMVYESLLSKYEDVSNKADSDFQGEKELTKDAQMWNEIGRAAAKGGNAYAESVGGANFDTSGFDRIGSNIDNRLSIADKERKEAVNSYILGKKLEQDDALNKEKLNKLKYGEPITPWQKEKLDLDRESLDLRRQELSKSGAKNEAQSKKDQMAEEKHQIFLDKENRQKESGERERHVKGYGLAYDKAAAKEMRENILATDKSVSLLQDVAGMGKNINPLDRNRWGLIEQKLNAAIGGLRISLTGPGPMTEGERAFIKETIGDPRKFLSTEENEIAKLNQLIKTIQDSKQNAATMYIAEPEGDTPEEKKAVNNTMAESAKQKPKTIKQNGFTYTLNEATGEYE